MCLSLFLATINVLWVCYDHSIRGNVKFIANFWLSLAQVNWNFVDRFIDVQQGPDPAAADSLQWFFTADNKLIKWPNTQTISYQSPFLLKQINSNSFMDKYPCPR